MRVLTIFFALSATAALTSSIAEAQVRRLTLTGTVAQADDPAGLFAPGLTAGVAFTYRAEVSGGPELNSPYEPSKLSFRRLSFSVGNAAVPYYGEWKSGGVIYAYYGDPHNPSIFFDLDDSSYDCCAYPDSDLDALYDFNFQALGVLANSGMGDFDLSDIPYGADFSYNILRPATLRGNISFSVVRATLASVPEPSTWGMMIGGISIVGIVMRRRKTAVANA